VRTNGTHRSAVASRVAICGFDPTFVELVGWNVERRGYRVRSSVCDPCLEILPPLEGSEAAVVVDLDDRSEPCWTLPTLIRRRHPSTHLVLLSFDDPDPRQLDVLEPCSHLLKPFAMRDFLLLLDSICGRA
jgi:hypothetical protein